MPQHGNASLGKARLGNAKGVKEGPNLFNQQSHLGVRPRRAFLEHTTMNPNEIAAVLAAPFPPDQLRWKPKSVSGSRCLALPYVTVAAVIGRLNEALGLDGWADTYGVLNGGVVLCSLRCRFGDQWIIRRDVGTSTGPEAAKGSYSDALK
jgi:hypothetical protein